MNGASGPNEEFQWYYIGHYGQLGPLSESQMRDLIQDGVIERDTYVWRTGMGDWLRAADTMEMARFLESYQTNVPPPPPSARPAEPISAPRMSGGMPGPAPHYPHAARPNYLESLPLSDRSRVAAGVLQFVLPGVGRMYLGYVAQGIIQFILAPCLLGVVWSWLDGIIMFTGGVKVDGYGRRIPD